MNKAIQYHVFSDVQEQQAIEEQVAGQMHRRTQQNKRAFASLMPSLLPYFDDLDAQDYGLFCNKQGLLNIASARSGQVVYGLNPQTEAEQEVQQALEASPAVSVLGHPIAHKPLIRAYQMPESSGYVPSLPLLPIPKQGGTLMMLGLGLGHALQSFIQQADLDNIVIYEPELDFFRASLQALDWHEVLSEATRKGTRLFIQVGQQGTSIFHDLIELGQAFQVERAYLYRHYHHEVMDCVFETLVQPGFSLTQLPENLELTPMSHVTQYLPVRAGQVRSTMSRDQAEQQIAAAQTLKQKNLAAFQEQFPDIYEQFASYRPIQWQAFFQDDGEINLYHEGRLGALFDHSPTEFGHQAVDIFTHEPNRNDMFTGYSGGKLWRYVHFTHARRFGKLLESMENSGRFVPTTMSSLIWFGFGLGHALKPLLETYQLKSLYIFEPNPDFFYWSLFTLPWYELLAQQKEQGMHWYMNIGDDGAYLQEDMFAQFHASGGYLAASSFFFVPHYLPALTPAIRQLKRDLQSYLMLGEYVDHVRYSLVHAYHNVNRGMRVLHAKAQLNEELANQAILLVGNGPSLDQSIQFLQANQDKFIIVSCGTALKPLYEAGIRPDFHADVEQNRATYQWVTQVEDRDWLKQVRLLSLTSIHPDTAALFKEQLSFLKDGENSTLAFLRRSGLREQLATLDYCYPTVTNFALSACVRMGFTNIYLLGVDLGFKDIEHHHSRSSAYYRDNNKKSWHDYKKSAGQGIPVAGNFQSYVLTKYEFQLARSIMERLIRDTESIHVFNMSDGAFIQGSQTLLTSECQLEAIQGKENYIQQLTEQLFFNDGLERLAAVVEEGFQAELMQQEAQRLLNITKQPVTSIDEAMTRLEQEKDYFYLLFQSSPSLYFYLMFASSHFASSALVRFLYSCETEAESLAYFEEASGIWRSYIQQALDTLIAEPYATDATVVKSLLPKDKVP